MPYVVFIAAPPVDIMRNMHEFARMRGKVETFKSVRRATCNQRPPFMLTSHSADWFIVFFVFRSKIFAPLSTNQRRSNATTKDFST